MECPACQAELPEESNFCHKCGTQLTLACQACGHGNLVQSRFCNQCGSALRAAPAAAVEAAAQAAMPAFTAERRQLSVMFCDIVGSVALAERLDPEDLHDLLSKFQRLGTKIVEASGGLVARYQGDGILAYFGYPKASEYDAEQAIITGLELVESVGQLGASDDKLKVRIGIATGVVIVGEITKSSQMDEPPIVGETPNLAARLQGIAEPNAIIIDERTRRLTGRLFECNDLGMQELKGFARPVRAWRVEGRSRIESRFEALHSVDVPLVGRQEELEFLSRRWHRVKAGEGQAVVLSGQAGIGKSRLIAAFENQLAAEPYGKLRYSCSPQHQGSALYPVINQLVYAAGIARTDSDERKLAKLRSAFAAFVRDPLDLLLIADLLSIPTGEAAAETEMSPQVRKLRTFAVLRGVIEELASRQPLLVVFEDAHWIDPTSVELIELCIDAVEHQSLLLIITSRPGFSPTWTDRSYVAQLPLNRLPRSDASALSRSIAGPKLSDPIFQQILDRADGVPLFIEELTKTVIESDLAAAGGKDAAASSPAAAIPSTLQGSLLARLDRLSPVRDVVQIGAAIGREFTYELLSAVCLLPQGQLLEALRQLVAAELIYRRTDSPNDSFRFRHALIQDAAYSTLLRNQRRELHARIAGALEERFADRASTEPEVFAYHFSQADLAEPSIKYWQAAAQRAAARAANVEAVDYFDKALTMLQTMPETAERDQGELMLLVGRGIPLTAIRSYAAADVGDNYRRAHELCKKMGTAPKIFPVLQGLYRYYLVGAELQAALDTTHQLLDIAGKSDDPILLMEAHQAQAFSLGFRGELPAAYGHFEKCMALFDPEHFRGRMHLYSTDTATSALCLGALIAWLRGYPDRSADITDKALARAREVNHPYTLAWALSFCAVLRQVRGEVGVTRKLADECVALCRQHDFPFWLASGRIMRGWSLTEEGEQVATGLRELREGLAGWHQTGARVYAPYFTGCLVEACLVAGNPADAVAPLAAIIDSVERTGEGWWQPELYRLQGELLGRTVGPGGDQARCFEQALALASRQGALSLALRAAMSLYRLADGTGRAQARDRLAAIVGQFTEGSSTRDLRLAGQLLDGRS